MYAIMNDIRQGKSCKSVSTKQLVNQRINDNVVFVERDVENARQADFKVN